MRGGWREGRERRCGKMGLKERESERSETGGKRREKTRGKK